MVSKRTPEADASRVASDAEEKRPWLRYLPVDKDGEAAPRDGCWWKENPPKGWGTTKKLGKRRAKRFRPPGRQPKSPR